MSEAEQLSKEEEERENCALFLGDLSIFCDEKDIEGAFSQFGEIIDIRIQRSKETSRALSYGFIEFAESSAAEEALNSMNYYLLKGRPLRIRWAASRKNPVKSATTPHDSAATVYVRFLTQTPEAVVSEESLRQLFNNYGPVFDCAIKKLSQDSKTQKTKGYAFVSFDSGVLIHGGVDVAGVDSAYRASIDLANRIIDNVRYRCELGHRLHKQMAPAAIVPVGFLPQQQGEGIAMGVLSAPFVPPSSYECPQPAPVEYTSAATAIYHTSSYPPAPTPTHYSQQQQNLVSPNAPPPTPRGPNEQYQYSNSNYQYAVSPRAMMSALSNARSPTNYEMRQMRAPTNTPKNAMSVQAQIQPHYASMYAQAGLQPQAHHVQQHSGYACTVPLTSSGVMMQSPASTPAASPRHYQPMTMPHHHMQQPMQQPVYTTSSAPYIANSQYPQYQYYGSSNAGTPTHANPEMGLRGRGVPMENGVGMNYVQYQYYGTSNAGTPTHANPEVGLRGRGVPMENSVGMNYVQYQYYGTSNAGTPTHANPEMGLRGRGVPAESGTAMSYMQSMPNGQMIPMSVVMVPMQPGQHQPGQQVSMHQQQYQQQQIPLTSGGYTQAFVPPQIQIQTQTQQEQEQQEQQQQGSSLPVGKAFMPPTPRGSCSDYFAATKGLNLRVSTNPVPPYPVEFTQQIAQPSGSRETTPKSIYSTRKATPSAKQTMLEHRSPAAQQAHMQQYMQKQPPAHAHMLQQASQRSIPPEISNPGRVHAKNQDAFSPNVSNESMTTTSLYIQQAAAAAADGSTDATAPAGAALCDAPQLGVVSSTSTEVFMPEGVPMTTDA